jgi:23S rRNA (uracil1939-C5)-methyltransferase
LSDEATLTIEKLVYGGDGLARLEGRVVFTPFVLPGETVRAELSRAKTDLLRGRLLDVVEPAGSRIEPRCPYFQRCGGCQYQHAAYDFQVEQKRAILREMLSRVGKIEFEGDIDVVAGEPWHYRNRVQLHIQGGQAGYFEAGTHRLCAIDQCPIASPKLNEAIGLLSRELPRLPWFTADIELFTNEIEVQVSVQDRVPMSARAVLERIGSTGPVEWPGFRVSRNSFFQVNRFLIERLVEEAVGGLAGDNAIDLYAGVGLFALRLAGNFRQVAAVESGWSAFRDLEVNVQRAGAAVTPEHRTAEEFLRGLERTPDLIVGDPPRTGLGKQVIAELLRLRGAKVVIVSCDPATLARDLRELLGVYEIERMTLVDLFPQTSHMETVVRLKLRLAARAV